MPENPAFGWAGWAGGSFGDGRGGGGGRFFDCDDDDEAPAAPLERDGIDGFFDDAAAPPPATDAWSFRVAAGSLHALFRSLISQLFVE